MAVPLGKTCLCPLFLPVFAALTVTVDAKEPSRVPENQRWVMRKPDETHVCLLALLLMWFLAHTCLFSGGSAVLGCLCFVRQAIVS